MSGGEGPKRRRVPLPATGDLPRIGKVRLGVKVEATGRSGEAVTRPSATDYFVVTDGDNGVTNPESAASFHDLYPGEPRVISCVLPAATADEVMEGAWRQYGTGKLKRKCDRVECDERTETGGWETKPCVCLAQGIPQEVESRAGYLMKNPQHCRLIWTLNVLLPGVQGVGVWQVETQSEISARRCANWLAMMEQIVGDLRGLPFDLHLVPVSVAPGGRAKTVYVLEPRGTRETQALIPSGRPRAGELEAGPVLPPAAADEDDSDYSYTDPDEHGDGGYDAGQPEPPPPAEPVGKSVGQERIERLKAMPQELEAAAPDRYHAAHLATIRDAVTSAGIPWKTRALEDDEVWVRVQNIVEVACLRNPDQAQQTLGGAA